MPTPSRLEELEFRLDQKYDAPTWYVDIIVKFFQVNCKLMKLYWTNCICMTSKELQMENRVHEKKLRIKNSCIELKLLMNLKYEKCPLIISGQWKLNLSPLLGHICVRLYNITKAVHHFLVVFARYFASI